MNATDLAKLDPWEMTSDELRDLFIPGEYPTTYGATVRVTEDFRLWFDVPGLNPILFGIPMNGIAVMAKWMIHLLGSRGEAYARALQSGTQAEQRLTYRKIGGL